MNPVHGASATQELAKAEQMLGAARVLMQAGYADSAVSRACYAVFHAACALLASVGRVTRSHDGVRSLVVEHFIRPGKLEARFARILSRMGADRNDADYDAVGFFTTEDAAQDIQHAEEFLAAVKSLLTP
ncbi:MAG: HEPN domain-containing protein [Myxococcota bacterium]